MEEEIVQIPEVQEEEPVKSAEMNVPFADVELPGLPVLVAVGVVLVTVILMVLVMRRRSKGKKNSILLMGPLGAGKTTLYLQLKEGSPMNGSVTSMEQNEDTFVPAQGSKGDKPVHFVDLPGHPRLIDKFEEYIGGAIGVVFVIDATDFIPHTRTIAEQMYRLLSNQDFYNRRIPIMLACNKSDMGAKVHTEHFIEKKLEREIESVRTSHSSLDGEAGGAPVGKEGSSFTFEDLKSKVSIAKISALVGGKNIQPVYEFMSICRRQV